MFQHRRKHAQEAELDITSFMNLMIILVPVLLMSMVFAHITVLDITLPDAGPGAEDDSEQPKILEVVIHPDYLDVNYPAGVRLKRIEPIASEDDPEVLEHDYALLSLTLREVKRLLEDQGTEKRDILILSQPDTDYQTLITTMDTVRSFKTVVVTDVVDAELFPAISLGDAPVADDTGEEG
jgi:biopolymer transport protein ExbD